MIKKINSFIPAYLAILVLSISGFIAYSNILHAPFVFYDDAFFIVNNYLIREFSNFKDLSIISSTRYVVFLSFAINYYFDGLNTFGYHVVNIIIHILNAILVYFLLILTFTVLSLRGALAAKPCPEQSEGTHEIASASPRNDITPIFIAFSVSLIFLVHPIQTHAVTYITGRFTSLATFFYLSAVVLYVKYRLKADGSRLKVLFYVLSVFSTILAMKTKEMSFTLPFIIILYEWTFFRDNDLQTMPLNSRLLYLMPYLLTLVIIPLGLFSGGHNSINLRILQVGDLEGLKDSLLRLRYEQFLTKFRIVVTQIRLLLFPINQSYWYADYPAYHSIFEPPVFLSIIFILSALFSAVYLYMRSRTIHGLLISFGILWFFITSSIELFMVGATDVLTEYRLYLPSAGFILAAVSIIFYSFDYLEKRFNRLLLKKYLLSVIAAIALSFLFAAYNRNIVWKSEAALWNDALKNIRTAKSEVKVRAELGRAYADQGRFDDAIR